MERLKEENYQMKYVKLLRVKHWIKNVLILLPLVFNAELQKADLLKECVWGVALFSVLASVIYIFNDIQDIESDKHHPVKCNRPIASGGISVKRAWQIGGIMLLALVGGGSD